MHTKTVNVIIFAVSQIVNLLIILYLAVLLAKLVWWLINPALGNIYIEKSSATEFEKSVKYVNNRYPFGIITKAVESAHEEPSIVSQIKLNGIYFNPPKSLAFVTYDDKPYIVGIGDAIMGNATLKSINTDIIVVSQNGTDVTIEMKPNRADNSNNSIAPLNSRTNYEADTSSTRSGNDDLKEHRKKLIEDFAQKTENNPSSNNNTENLNNSLTPNEKINLNNDKNNSNNLQEGNRAFKSNSNSANTVQTNP